MIKIYQSGSKANFLDDVATFAIENFASDLSKLKILLPSGLLCSELQKAIIKKLGASILPSIIPLGELVAESEEIFKIPSEQIGTISKLEEKIILAQIIHTYDKLNYDLAQSLRLAPALAGLFFEFEANNIELKTIKDIPVLEQPQHWHTIYDFLSYAADNWYKQIGFLHKMSLASHQKLVFAAELARLQNDKNESLLIAGITGINLITNEFIKSAVELPNAHLIISPTANANLKAKFSPEAALYKIHKLLELFPHTNALLSVPDLSILDKLITDNSPDNFEQEINYLEFENIFQEAEYIAAKCNEMLLENKVNKIAIIAHTQAAKEQYCIFMDKYHLSYSDLFGKDILKENVVSLMLLLAELLCCEFNSKSFFSLLSHPLLNSPEAQQVKNLIRKNNRLIVSLEAIAELIHQSGDSILKEYFLNIHQLLTTKLKSNKFDYIFRRLVDTLEAMIPNVWHRFPNIATPLSSIAQANCQFHVRDLENFPDLLKQLLDGGRISASNTAENIVICRAHDAAFINYDLVIIADLNENTFPNAPHNSPWLNLHMQNELKLTSMQARLGESLYNFYLNIHNKKVLLTRAKRQGSSKQILPSPFILHLQHILGSKIPSKIAIRTEEIIATRQAENFAISNCFPQQISATDIEMLVRAPYNFYAKKILNLRKIEEIDERPNLAEFGNFFHQVVELYTKNYQSTEAERVLAITEIGKSILETSNIPNYSKKTWATKLLAIAPEFIEFDEKRRKNSARIYSEIRGQLTITIAKTKLKIIAITDRIEIDQDGKAIVLDYKTGAVPTKKDVLSGLSPQLLVEAILISEGGFAIRPLSKLAPVSLSGGVHGAENRSVLKSHSEDLSTGSEQQLSTGVEFGKRSIESTTVSKLVYVKINSSTPYITTTEIDISQEALYQHKQGLLSLLEHYIATKQFPIEPNLMKYDNYQHLARRL